MSKASDYAKAMRPAVPIVQPEVGGLLAIPPIFSSDKEVHAYTRGFDDGRQFQRGAETITVSKSGEIKGTLPCGHEIHSVEIYGGRYTCGPCRLGNRSPAP